MTRHLHDTHPSSSSSSSITSAKKCESAYDADGGGHSTVQVPDLLFFKRDGAPTNSASTVPSTAKDCTRTTTIASQHNYPAANCRNFFLPCQRSPPLLLPHFFLLLFLAFLRLSFGSAESASFSSSSASAMPPPLCPSSLLINISYSALLSNNNNYNNNSRNSAEVHRHADAAARPLYLIMEYWPPHGRPASPFTLNGPMTVPSTEKTAATAVGRDANFTIRINGTWPAVRYHYTLSAVYEEKGTDNGDKERRRTTTVGSNGTATTPTTELLHKGIAYSSPDKPVLVSVAATERACTLAWAAPPALSLPQQQQQQQQQPNYAYYMEYFSVVSSDFVFYARTKANSVRLRKLRTGTQYRLALFSEYFGVRSLCPLELAFRTRRRTIPSRYGNKSATISSTATTTTKTTAAAIFNPVDTRKSHILTTSVYHRNTTVMSRLPSLKENSTMLSVNKQDRIQTKSSLTTKPVVTMTTNSSSSTTTTTTMASTTSAITTIKASHGQESVEMPESRTGKKQEDEKTVEETEESSKESYGSDADGEEEEEEAEEETDPPVDKESPKESNNETAETQAEPPIRMRQHGTRSLVIAWRVPELVACDAFLVRHRPLGLANGRIGTQRTITPQALLPLVANACIEVNVSCLFENTVSPQWKARRVLDLRTPAPVQSVRVIRSYTDEYFQASVLLGFGLPPKTGKAHFQLYEVHIAWAQGKKVVGRQQVVFRGEHIYKLGTAGGKSLEGQVNITGLEPAQMYTFAVRNVSRELPSQCSAPLGVRLITPPIITSTLYAGKISSHSINVNFGESDPSHKFEQYELHFDSSTGGTATDDNNNNEEEAMANRGGKFKNANGGRGEGEAKPSTLIRRLAKNDTKSFTFNKLVPGKTYTFALFTLLHGVRSRPVDVNITTYPLKVPTFHPLIGSGYVRLFWTVRNDAHNLCRFRLSYTASAGPHLHSALSLELNGSVVTHRFSALDWNTFYTFTITVIMGPPEAEAESESEAVTIGMANRPRSTPQLKRYGSRELLLSFENDPEAFPDRNGVISEFAVIVAERVTLEGATVADTAEDNKTETQNLLETLGDVWELPSWHDARERADDAEEDGTPWIAYRTSPSNYNPFPRRTSSRIAQFVIGSEDCVPGRRRLDEMYCNGPLRANVDYFVRVRAFSVGGIAMETAWVGIDGAVPHATGKQLTAAEQKQQWRLPCYMYLNGCYASRESSVGSNAAQQGIASNGTKCWWLLTTIIVSILVESNLMTH